MESIITHQVWHKAYNWLTQQWQQRMGTGTIDQTLQLFLAAHLCEQQLFNATPLTEAIIPSFYDTIGQMNPALQEADPYLFLLAVQVLQDKAFPLAPFAAYLNEIQTAIIEAWQSSPELPIQVYLVWQLVTRLIGQHANTPPIALPDMPDWSDIYALSDEDSMSFCKHYIAQTLNGSGANAPLQNEHQLLAEALPAIALAYLRDYKLDLACEVLKTLHYIGYGDYVAGQAIPFLVLQQQPCGAFGFLSPKGRHLLEQRHADIDGEAHLPVTLICLSTLALYLNNTDLLHSPSHTTGLWETISPLTKNVDSRSSRS